MYKYLKNRHNIFNSISQKRKLKNKNLFKNLTQACFLLIPVMHLTECVFRNLPNIYDGAFRENS